MININSADETIQPWGIGYKISNRYEIRGIKKGGMGVVYFAYDHDMNNTYALKTFQDNFLWDSEVINDFINEAKIWSSFEPHPNLTNAFLVEKIEEKPLIFLEYANMGDLSQFVGNLAILEALDFAIQVCNGMEYVYNKFGAVHKDIKPGNLLIQEDLRFRYGYCIKITDFGLTEVLGEKIKEGVHALSGMGTEEYTPPEQFQSELKELFSFEGKVTTKSDIYSFGVTFYHLLTGKLPFDSINDKFTKDPVNPKDLNTEITENLDEILMKCIKKNPDERYSDFYELKKDLINYNNTLTGKKDYLTSEEELTYIGLNLKGLSFLNLKEYEKAMNYLNKCLKINPDFVEGWNNKGLAAAGMKRIEDALICYDKALSIDSSYAGAWNNKGVILANLEDYDEALVCFDTALDENPKIAEIWINKGNALDLMRNPRESIKCYQEALKIDKRNEKAWYNKGVALSSLEEYSDAENAYNHTLNIIPRCYGAYINKGIAIAQLNKYPEAIECFDKALEIHPNSIDAWSNKGIVFRLMGEIQTALECCDRALKLNSEYYGAYINKGIAIAQLNKYPEAIECFDKALEIHPNSIEAWFHKGNVLSLMGEIQEALNCFNKASKLNENI